MKITKQSGLSLVLIAVILAAVIGAGIFGFMYYKNLSGKADKSAAAAIVNGEVISIDNLETRLFDIEKSQGQKPEAMQALQQMIEEKLLLMEAKKNNITADEAKVEEEYAQAIQTLGGEEEFKKRMSEFRLTPDKLRQNIRTQMIINQYLEGKIDIKTIVIAEKDIKDIYDKAKAENKDIPSLAEVREQIKNELTQQKIGILVRELIDVLRGAAVVETLYSETESN